MFITLHSETLYSLDRARLRARIAELEAKHPGSTIKARRLARWGAGYTLTVKGEGVAKSIQRRGHCQFCGNHQVVKDGVLVLHGYQRPGNGWIFGRCPGAALKPLQTEEAYTRAVRATTVERLAKLQKALPKLDLAAAQAEKHYNQAEPGMLYAMPSKGYKYGASDTEKAELEKAYLARLDAWFVSHPATHAHVVARDALRAHNVAISQAQGGVDHFNLLLSWKLLGTPLVEVAKG